MLYKAVIGTIQWNFKIDGPFETNAHMVKYLPCLDGKLYSGITKTMRIYMFLLVNTLELKREGMLLTNASSLPRLSLSSSEISDTLQWKEA